MFTRLGASSNQGGDFGDERRGSRFSFGDALAQIIQMSAVHLRQPPDGWTCGI